MVKKVVLLSDSEDDFAKDEEAPQQLTSETKAKAKHAQSKLSIKNKPIQKQKKQTKTEDLSHLFKTDLAQDDLKALQSDQDRQTRQKELDEKRDQRKQEMDKHNRKVGKTDRRTGDQAKGMVF